MTIDKATSTTKTSHGGTTPAKFSVLRGVVERITFHNEENGYTVAKLLPELYSGNAGNNYAGGNFKGGNPREVAIVGNMSSINVGESVELTGRWTVHAEYGRQFSVEQMRSVLPATIAGIEKYLGSGLIKGVGPVTAKRIVQHFGLDTLNVIEQDASQLNEVPGVGRKRVRLITQAWAEQHAIKEVMLFLQSHGVSTSLATKIYKYYGDEAIGVVQQDPYRLAHDIFGIGFLTADKIARSLGIPANAPQRVAAGIAFSLNQAADDGHVYLPTSELIQQTSKLLDVTPQQAGLGILHLWRDDLVKVADTPGGEEKHPDSLSSASSELAASGINQQTELGEIPQLIAEPGGLYAMATQQQAQTLLAEERAVYLTPLFYSEMGVANRLDRLCRIGISFLQQHFSHHTDWGSKFQEIAKKVGIRLATQQQKAVQTSLTHRVTILTGGPGTGKTTTVSTILALCQQTQARVLLAAPTGRAAKRLSETTGREAKTLHRLLEFQPAAGMAFKRDEESPLEGELLIVDEASMLDLALMNHLLKAIPAGMHLLLVGDVDQLPSVGAGNVLKDMIAAIERTEIQDIASGNQGMDATQANPHLLIPGMAKVVRLETIFRQAAGSYIITNAHRINEGQIPTVDNENANDFFLFKTEEPQRAAQLCVELVTTRIPRRFAIPSADIQVLSPMHRGVVGVGALNEQLQQALNPPAPNKPERRIGSRAYRPQDRVMQIRNNYDKDVYNGDMGTILSVNLEMQNLTINFEGRAVPYDFLELDELVHAYAVSVHKSQGSEFPAVVIPILTTHYMMLQRNLLYTAVTRAKRLVVLVGQTKAIAIAVNNNKVTERHTGLMERLEQTSLR
ncbi:AAA family ATPase [Chloroflexi bacterium TSY]|nr:AAA family ATPase [Chloroflexi bacterium TSY]